MREIINQVDRWLHEGKQVAIAAVVWVSGSSLRPAGAKMAVSSLSEIAGSVSGGCVEGAVAAEAQEVIKNGVPRLLKFGISDETAWGVGLACGGTVRIYIEKLDWKKEEGFTISGIYEKLKEFLEEERLFTIATVISGPGTGNKWLFCPDGINLGSLGNAALSETAGSYMSDALASQEPCLFSADLAEGRAEVFIDVYPPPARLVVIGAVHIAIPLISYAKTLGFHTIVIDARSAFATCQRFKDADELIVSWPQDIIEKLHLDEATYIAVISHDDKLDIPALQAALKSSARYIGVLGSRKTQARRIESLKQLGFTDIQLERIHSPIGLNIGAKTPEEIALSIIAEVVATHHGISNKSH